MKDVFNIIGADRFGRVERLPHGIEIVQIALPEFSRFQQQAVAAGPFRRLFARRIAAVENIVFRLTFDGLEGKPAEIAGAKLQDAKGDQLLVLRGDGDVAAIGVNFAVVQKLDHDGRVGFFRGHGHLPNGVELGPAAAK